ncbi:MAG TPA: hypothetical protein PKX90_08145, partial [bacterium]|nr:hypothetical protein [bacterium]
WRYDENYFTHIEIINFNNKKIIHNLEKTIASNSDILKYNLLDNDFILIEKRPALEKINVLIISNLFNTNIYSFNSDVTFFEILNFLKYQYSDTQLTTLTLYRNGELEQSLIIENNINKLNEEIFLQNNDILFIENFPKYKKINLLAENIKEKEFILQTNERLIDLIKKINFSIDDDYIQIAYIKSKTGENNVVILNDLLNNTQNSNINLSDGDFIQIKEYVELPFDSSYWQIPKDDIISYEYKFKNIEVEKIIEEIKKYFENKNVFVLNYSNNSLIIKDKPLNIKKIIPVLENLDKAYTIKQFKITAQIVEVSFNNEDDFGMSVGEVVDNDNLGKNFFNYNSIDGQIIFRSYPSNIQIILNNLKKKGKVNTLSRPNIVAINKKEAEILVGNQIPFKKAMYDISANNNNNNAITSNVSYEFKDVFIRLKVTPDFIFPDKILLNIQPEANSLAGYTTDNQPIINTRKATTSILIKSGETVFIGGMISTNNTEVEQKNKLFEKIPLINTLFTTKKKSDSRTELIVLLSCEIIE